MASITHGTGTAWWHTCIIVTHCLSDLYFPGWPALAYLRPLSRRGFQSGRRGWNKRSEHGWSNSVCRAAKGRRALLNWLCFLLRVLFRPSRGTTRNYDCWQALSQFQPDVFIKIKCRSITTGEEKSERGDGFGEDVCLNFRVCAISSIAALSGVRKKNKANLKISSRAGLAEAWRPYVSPCTGWGWLLNCCIDWFSNHGSFNKCIGCS